MGKIIIKDGVRYTEQLAKRLGIKGDETRETEPAHADGVVRVDGAPVGVVQRGDVRTSDNTLITTDKASLPSGKREEGTLPGSIGTVGAPAPVQEGTPNDGNTDGTDTGTVSGDDGGSSDSSEKTSKRPARGAGSKAS